jgi:hypothetical protein
MNEDEDGFIKFPRCGGEMEKGDKLVGYDGVATRFFK